MNLCARILVHRFCVRMHPAAFRMLELQEDVKIAVRGTNNLLRRLVGVDLVQPSGSAALDKFLRLPDDTLAVMACRFIFPMSTLAMTPADGLAPTSEGAFARL